MIRKKKPAIDAAIDRALSKSLPMAVEETVEEPIINDEAHLDEEEAIEPIAEEAVEPIAEEPTTPAPRKRGRPKKVTTPNAPAPAPAPITTTTAKRRGRPATDRTLIMERMIEVLRELDSDRVVFSRKELNHLAENNHVPISYVLHFVKECSTPIRGMFVLPRRWRSRWDGYDKALKSLFSQILAK